MSCKENRKSIFMYPELDPTDRKSIDEHLKVCPPCASLFKSVNWTRSVVENVGKHPVEISNPVWLTDTIMKKIQSEQQVIKISTQYRTMHWLFQGFRYGMATLSIVLALFLFLEMTTPPSVAFRHKTVSGKKHVLLSKNNMAEAYNRWKNSDKKETAWRKCYTSVSTREAILACFKERTNFNKFK